MAGHRATAPSVTAMFEQPGEHDRLRTDIEEFD